MAIQGEPGYERALSEPDWGFSAVLLGGEPLRMKRSFDSYVMENILFKVLYPAEFHGQTAVEAAIRLYPEVKCKLDAVRQVVIETQESACRIINKEGILRNPSDRDHCLQYMVAVALIYGELGHEHYSDKIAADPRIERLIRKIRIFENTGFSRDYLDPEKRSIANAVQVHFVDGSSTENILIEYPLGHRKRRQEAIPLLKQKFVANIATCLPRGRCNEIVEKFDNPSLLESLPTNDFLDLFVV